MSLSLHAADAIAAFAGKGETRLIVATYRDRRRGEVFVLPDGQARAMREMTKRHLRCVFEDCPSPALTTVHRSRGRDGFRHISGATGHAPESVNHRQGKAVIAQWLRSKFGPAAVQVEMAADTQRTRIPDVTLTLPTGQRVAFEVQYAPLTVEAWQRRHESFAELGMLDIWLWGHTRLRRSRRDFDDNFRLEDVQEQARLSGSPVVFLNPETEQLAIAISTTPTETIADDRYASVSVSPLHSFTVTTTGVTSPLLARLVAATAARKAEEAIRIVEEAERQRQRAEAQEARYQHAAQRIAARADRRDPRVTRYALQTLSDYLRDPRGSTHQDPSDGQVEARSLTRSARARCWACHYPLDPIYERAGRHPDCISRSTVRRRT